MGDVDAFCTWMRLVGMSDETVRRRRLTLGQLKRYVAPAELSTVTGATVEEWLGRWTSANTRHAYLGDVRAYFKWACQRGLAAADPTGGIGNVRVPATLPRPLDDSALAFVLASNPDWRVRLALCLASMAGLRRAEVVALDWSDIHLDVRPATLTVRGGKGGKDRALPVHPALAAELGVPKRSGPVVTTLNGRPMTKDHLGKLVSRALRDAGIVGGVHRGRHRFGTQAARASGGDLLAVAQLMGHANPATTAGYVALAAVRSAEVIGAMPWLDHMGG